MTPIPKLTPAQVEGLRAIAAGVVYTWRGICMRISPPLLLDLENQGLADHGLASKLDPWKVPIVLTDLGLRALQAHDRADQAPGPTDPSDQAARDARACTGG